MTPVRTFFPLWLACSPSRSKTMFFPAVFCDLQTSQSFADKFTGSQRVSLILFFTFEIIYVKICVSHLTERFDFFPANKLNVEVFRSVIENYEWPGNRRCICQWRFTGTSTSKINRCF